MCLSCQRRKKFGSPWQTLPAKDWEIQLAARLMISAVAARIPSGVPPGKGLRILAQESGKGQEGIPGIFKYTHKLRKFPAEFSSTH